MYFLFFYPYIHGNKQQREKASFLILILSIFENIQV